MGQLSRTGHKTIRQGLCQHLNLDHKGLDDFKANVLSAAVKLAQDFRDNAAGSNNTRPDLGDEEEQHDAQQEGQGDRAAAADTLDAFRSAVVAAADGMCTAFFGSDAAGRWRSHAQVLQVDAVVNGAKSWRITCRACFGPVGRGHPVGIFYSAGRMDLKSLKRHCGKGDHQIACAKWMHDVMVDTSGDRSHAPLPFHARSGAKLRRAGPQTMSALINEAGLAFLMDTVVQAALEREGWLFARILAAVPEGIVHKEAAAERVRPVLLRMIGALALLGGTGRPPVAAGPAAHLQPVPALQALASYLQVAAVGSRPQVYLRGPGQDDLVRTKAFCAALTGAYGFFKERFVNRAPVVLCWSARGPSGAHAYVTAAAFAHWLVGFGVALEDEADMDNDGDNSSNGGNGGVDKGSSSRGFAAVAEEEEEAVMLSGHGDRARIHQEYKVVATYVRAMVHALRVLVQAGYFQQAKETGAEAATGQGAKLWPEAVSAWFSETEKLLLNDVSSCVRAASGVRAYQLLQRTEMLCQFVIDVKHRVVACCDLLEQLTGAVARCLAKRSAELRTSRSRAVGAELEDTSATMRAALVRDVLVPILLQPAVEDVINLGFALTMQLLLGGSRPGWLLRLGSSLLLSENEQSALYKLRGSVFWNQDGWATIGSTGDKTRRVTGAVFHDLPDVAQYVVTLCELKLLAVLARASDHGLSPLWSPATGTISATRLRVPVLLQQQETRRRGRVVLAPVLVSHTGLFRAFRRACNFPFQDLCVADWDAWAAHTLSAQAVPTEWLAAYEQGCSGRDAEGARRPEVVPKFVQHCGWWRITMSYVMTLLADHNVELEQAVATVQAHSLDTQRNVYTPATRVELTKHASRQVQSMLGVRGTAYGQGRNTHTMVQLKAQLRALWPAADPDLALQRLSAGLILGLPWRAPGRQAQTLEAHFEGVAAALVRLVHYRETGQGAGEAVILPFPPAFESGSWRWPCVLRERAFNLRCSDCKQMLVVLERPLERSPNWVHVVDQNHRLIEEVFMGQEGLQYVLKGEGILVCPGAVIVEDDRARRCKGLIKAVITTNSLLVRDIDRSEACARWPWCIRLFEPKSM